MRFNEQLIVNCNLKIVSTFHVYYATLNMINSQKYDKWTENLDELILIKCKILTSIIQNKMYSPFSNQIYHNNQYQSRYYFDFK